MKTILVDAVNSFVDTKGNIFKNMQTLLDTYPNRKIILTGADYEADNSYNLNNMPYKVFTLKHNPEKTDPKYYEMILEHFNLKAEDVLCFEHNPEAVKSAQSVGIETFYYDKNKKDLVALKKFIDENL